MASSNIAENNEIVEKIEENSCAGFSKKPTMKKRGCARKLYHVVSRVFSDDYPVQKIHVERRKDTTNENAEHEKSDEVKKCEPQYCVPFKESYSPKFYRITNLEGIDLMNHPLLSNENERPVAIHEICPDGTIKKIHQSPAEDIKKDTRNQPPNFIPIQNNTSFQHYNHREMHERSRDYTSNNVHRSHVEVVNGSTHEQPPNFIPMQNNSSFQHYNHPGMYESARDYTSNNVHRSPVEVVNGSTHVQPPNFIPMQNNTSFQHYNHPEMYESARDCISNNVHRSPVEVVNGSTHVQPPNFIPIQDNTSFQHYNHSEMYENPSAMAYGNTYPQPPAYCYPLLNTDNFPMYYNPGICTYVPEMTNGTMYGPMPIGTMYGPLPNGAMYGPLPNGAMYGPVPNKPICGYMPNGLYGPITAGTVHYGHYSPYAMDQSINAIPPENTCEQPPNLPKTEFNQNN